MVSVEEIGWTDASLAAALVRVLEQNSGSFSATEISNLLKDRSHKALYSVERIESVLQILARRKTIVFHSENTSYSR